MRLRLFVALIPMGITSAAQNLFLTLRRKVRYVIYVKEIHQMTNRKSSQVSRTTSKIFLSAHNIISIYIIPLSMRNLANRYYPCQMLLQDAICAKCTRTRAKIGEFVSYKFLPFLKLNNKIHQSI